MRYKYNKEPFNKRLLENENIEWSKNNPTLNWFHVTLLNVVRLRFAYVFDFEPISSAFFINIFNVDLCRIVRTRLSLIFCFMSATG